MRFHFIKHHVDNQFYPVSEKEIEEVETTLKMKFPSDLREFYIEVGYGFIKGAHINRIMGPASVRDARLKVNDFAFYPDIEIYEELEEDKFIFFEANESTLLLMELSEEKNNAIYYDEIKIADSFEAFLRKIIDDDDYYMDKEE
ncbi:SMI1/KNR4 family protein [Bacillus sp. RAR_GA_16]|uniref:SMI1/KNR4 family protein n=1 Tax=Bacillus sp. RAR_GA_16 TaxID=2876774 RepID=UPI001CCD1D17|nr:SMI1/KNR4 family protein [Bacillus sp. RAR_GA_16]MCA0174652.1 SMI1/KNR4 family protein [Bacillus sp. RAR_GA_16]